MKGSGRARGYPYISVRVRLSSLHGRLHHDSNRLGRRNVTGKENQNWLFINQQTQKKNF